MTNKEWLNLPPKPEDISTNPDGSEFIPIGLVEEKLDYLTAGNWSTKNFKFNLFQLEYTMLLSGSLELVVRYSPYDDDQGMIERTIVGSATFEAKDMGNNVDFEAVCTSECIKNASKKLGVAFGRGLNGRLSELKKGGNGKTEKKAVLIPAPDNIKQQYAKAIETGNKGKIQAIEAVYCDLN